MQICICKRVAMYATTTCKWTTHDWTATNACLKISYGKASVGMSNGYCCVPRNLWENESLSFKKANSEMFMQFENTEVKP